MAAIDDHAEKRMSFQASPVWCVSGRRARRPYKILAYQAGALSVRPNAVELIPKRLVASPASRRWSSPHLTSGIVARHNERLRFEKQPPVGLVKDETILQGDIESRCNTDPGHHESALVPDLHLTHDRVAPGGTSTVRRSRS